MKATAINTSPFPGPPENLLEGAIGWRFLKETVNRSTWRPIGWEVVYPDHILSVDSRTMLAFRDSMLYAPVPQ